MNTIKKSGLWIAAAFICLVFLLAVPAFSQELTTEVQEPQNGIVSGYVRDDADWDRMVSGTLVVRDADRAGLALAELRFDANRFHAGYSKKYGDGWHYFEVSLDPALTEGKTLSFEIIADEPAAQEQTRSDTQENASAVQKENEANAGAQEVSTKASVTDKPQTDAAREQSDKDASAEKQQTKNNGPEQYAKPETASAMDADETFTASDGSNYTKGAYQGSFKLVGYTGRGLTYTGTTTTAGRTVAADPDVLPLGSKIILNGVVYTVEDIGGAVKGQMVDIYFDTYEEAAAVTHKGWQYADVWLAEPAA